MKIPGKANVNKSLVDLRKSLKECLAQVNQEAGMLLSKGSYARARIASQSREVRRYFPRRR